MKIVLCVALCAVAVTGSTGRHKRSPGLFGFDVPGTPNKVASTLTQLPQKVSQRVSDVRPTIPFSDGGFDKVFGSSDEMVKSFRKQQTKSLSSLSDILPAGLSLPDISLPSLPFGSPFGAGSSKPEASVSAPPKPQFDRSLHLHTDRIVPLSGFTESFETEWHAESDTMRKVQEGTTVYRTPQPDGKLQFLEVREEQQGKNKVHRCTRTVVGLAAPGQKAFPGLPDLSDYEFVGNSTTEIWRKVIKGKPGENGAVKGETLTVTHEMLVAREKAGPVPVRYSVTTDSSILGPGSDVFIHTYKVLPPPTGPIQPDTSKCQTVLDANKSRPKRQGLFSSITDTVSKFNPVQDFSLPFGGDIGPKFDSFKDQFKRNYLDAAEEAVRKNLLTQSTRFIESANRATSSYKLATNFLADRLEEEINQLFGIKEPEGLVEEGLVTFPYSEKEVKEAENKLPEEFDWRKLGAVSPVRYQGTTCASCWAFAVAGSTEGALFKKTNQLVPLSPQCLVDCGKPFGAQGCGPTWPSFAYDYIQNRGLSAWDEYDYEAKVLECKDTSVQPVTHISGHVNVTANSEPALKLAIKDHAPTVVLVDAMAKSFIYYKSGVLDDKTCGQSKPRLNHAVVAVGWGSKDDGKDAPHFILKNSWSDKWGDEGYIRVAPGSCAVMERPTYSLVNEPNVDRQALRSSYKD